MDRTFITKGIVAVASTAVVFVLSLFSNAQADTSIDTIQVEEKASQDLQTSVDFCKDGRWERFTQIKPEIQSENDCVSYVESNGQVTLR
jgi:hypothetical protein